MRAFRSVSMLAVMGAALACVTTAAAQDAPPATPRPLVLVHAEGWGDLEIKRDTPLGWTTVCSGACDAWLPADGSYRAFGPTMMTSPSFTLRADPGQVETVRVRGGNEALFVLGMVGVVGGGTVAYFTWPVAATLALCYAGQATSGSAGASYGSGSSGGGCMSQVDQGMLAAFLVSGTVLLVGTALVVGNAKTAVDQLFPPPPAPSATRATPAAQPFLATPAWKESPSAAERSPPLMDLPLVGARF